MCGIIGMITNEGYIGAERRKNFAIQAIYADAVRGWDSTGFMAMEDGIVDVYKRALTASDFIGLRKTGKMIDNIDKYQYFIGHNRAATKGGVFDHTAHPFDFENVTGVHNGTLWGHEKLPGGKDFDVDSEAIFNALNHKSIDEVIPQLDGAFALVWFDKRDNRIHLIRNDERPLGLAYLKNFNTVLLASEIEMLKWLSIRNGIEVEKFEMLKPGELVTFDYLADKREIMNPERRMVELKPKYEKNVYRNSDWGNNKAKGKMDQTREILKTLGVKLGERIKFVVGTVEKYKESQTGIGTLEGWMEDYPYITVFCHGVKVEDWDEWKDGQDNWLVDGQIVNAFPSNNYEDSVVVKNLIIRSKKHAIIAASQEDKKGEIIPFKADEEKPGEYAEPEKFYGPGNTEITKDEYSAAVKDGCVHCQGPIYNYEADNVCWDAYGNPICPDCVTVLGYNNFY